MSYAVKELYFTLQGEGAQAGHAAVFLRFAGCNLWSGREADRSAAVCQFCAADSSLAASTVNLVSAPSCAFATRHVSCAYA